MQKFLLTTTKTMKPEMDFHIRSQCNFIDLAFSPHHWFDNVHWGDIDQRVLARQTLATDSSEKWQTKSCIIDSNHWHRNQMNRFQFYALNFIQFICRLLTEQIAFFC